jgi:ubiquinone/menaquinone biosynthesis C-methylase UbiE
MAEFASERARQFYARVYDARVSDWPGEIDFYRQLAAEAKAKHQAVLELACGTGRVSIRLALDGLQVVGLDSSPAMLAVARKKSASLNNMRWVQSDMRFFNLNESFGLIIIPAHSYQNLLSVQDQISCLERIHQHLSPEGVLVVHLDHQEMDWLGDLVGDLGGVFEEAESFNHPDTGQQIRTSRAWSYQPATQTAISETVWEEFDGEGKVSDRWESGPLRFHCAFRFEMEHLLARTGFEVQAVYGDFFGGELQDNSAEMVWVAKNIQS